MSKTDLEQGLNLTNDGKVPARRFPEFRNFPLWQKLQLNQVLDYARPDKYIVNSTNYKTAGIPVLTANKSFVLGYTQEDFGIYEYLPVVIFDDFTTDKKFVDFPFKIKSSAIKILKPKNNENLKFIFEVMNQIKFEVSDHKRHYISEYQNLVVKIPEFTEQKKIADCLTSLDNLISQKQSELGALAKYKKGLLQQLFPQGNHNLPAKRFPEFENSPPWQSGILGDIGKVCMCKRVMKHETSETGDIPFYKIGTFGKKADAYISEELYYDYKQRYSFPRQGDILISASGTIGRTVVYNGEPAYFQDSNIVWISNDETKVTNKFLRYLYEIVKWVTDNSTIARLYNDNLTSIKILYPQQPEEQNAIAGCLTSLDNLISQKRRELDTLSCYKKGLLQQLLVQG